MKKQFIVRKFNRKSRQQIERANEIIAEYQQQRLKMTLRQLYYQFVARAFIENSLREYAKLGALINNARLAGLIDWDAIEDRTRNRRRVSTWSSPSSIIDSCVYSYRVDLWKGQKYRPEVWIEKDALIGVISGVCNELRVPYFSCRGFVSQSEMFDSGYRRFRDLLDRAIVPVIVHLGDHDPSGIDMTRDILDRMRMFSAGDWNEEPIVDRIALNFEQVEEHKPPPNPAKQTDSRFKEYAEDFGEESWELDALTPGILQTLIRETVDHYISDRELWELREDEEAQARAELEKISSNYEGVIEFLGNGSSDEHS